VTCNDNNGCTDDTCDSDSGCVYTNNTASCDDSNVCTVTDACAGGTCVGTGAKDCDDDNTCSVDTCDSVSGCANTMVSNCCGNGISGEVVDGTTEECDDGNQEDGDACTSFCKSEACGGWEYNDACWYVSPHLTSCNTFCADHCGFDAEGSRSSGNEVVLHFYPTASSGNAFKTLECYMWQANIAYKGTGDLPTGDEKLFLCDYMCACEC
jgi:cysteine-rich repeat protein